MVSRWNCKQALTIAIVSYIIKLVIIYTHLKKTYKKTLEKLY